MATQQERRLYLSAFYLDQSTMDKVDRFIDRNLLPIQRKTTEELINEIKASDRSTEDKNWLFRFL